VSERLRKLEENAYITGYHATVDPRSWEDVTAFILVSVDSSKHYAQFIEHAHAVDEILECHAVTGEGSHLLKIRTTNTGSLERLLAKIQACRRRGTRTTSSFPARKRRCGSSGGNEIAWRVGISDARRIVNVHFQHYSFTKGTSYGKEHCEHLFRL